jgi:hypothetical protein
MKTSDAFASDEIPHLKSFLSCGSCRKFQAVVCPPGTPENAPRPGRWEDFQYFLPFVHKKKIRFQKGEKGVDAPALGKINTLVVHRPLSFSHEAPKPAAKIHGKKDPFQLFCAQGWRNCKRMGPKMIRKVTGMIQKTRGNSILTGISCTAFSAFCDCLSLIVRDN